MGSRSLLSIILLTCILINSLEASVNEKNSFKCNTKEEGYERIKGDSGFLVINRSKPNCGFKTQDNTQFLSIKTDNLVLQQGDVFKIGSSTDDDKYTYQPPFDAGYFITGLREPVISITFNKTDNTTELSVEFSLKASDKAIQAVDFDINGDINNYFQITPLELESLTLNFSKTVTQLLHLQLTGATIADSTSRHKLISEQTRSIPIKFKGSQLVRIETSPAYANCSNDYTDSAEQSHEITGPDASILKRSYKCVNLFSFAEKIPDPAHYEADFNNFLGFADSGDRLILDDGSPETGLNIINSETSQYKGQVVSFSGRNLAVIYESTRVIKPGKVQFKLTVQPKLKGGIVDHEGFLNFTGSGEARYVLKPRFQEIAAIEISSNFNLQVANLTITKGDKIIAVFSDNTLLPPIIALDEPNVPMILDFYAKDYAKLYNSIKFQSLKSSCHRITSGAIGSFSVVAGQGPCYWTVASKENVRLTINNNDLIPNGCLTIQPLTQGEPIYSNCSISKSEVLPTFNIRQAYINVTLKSNDTSFDASLSISQRKAVTELENSSEIELYSSGYPVFYDWSSEGETFLLNATGKNYVLSIEDADLRVGEKILVANGEVTTLKRDDLILSNKTVANITIAKSISTNDFSHHRGFRLKMSQFDTIVTADLSKKQFVSPKNITSLYLKISASKSSEKSTEFAKRILYNITSTNSTADFSLKVIDGRSLLGRSIIGDKYHNASTSDTIIISYRVLSHQPAKLPELTINYDTVACNKTSDHICDNETRCVPFDLLCKGISYCDDGSDLKLACTSGPAPKPTIIETGVGGMTVFVLCVLMLIIGAVSALYGPDLIKTLETRFRSGQYTTFTSTE